MKIEIISSFNIDEIELSSVGNFVGKFVLFICYMPSFKA